MKIKRGEVWWIDLNPVIGDEAAKIRPCLIVQNDIGNLHSKKTIIVPLLKPKNYPFVVNISPTKLNGLDRERGLDLSHIRSVSIKRIKNKLGVIEDKYWSDIRKAIFLQLGFDKIFN
jgi:mRNA interferase MazF